ncbi:MAG: hypothetical protein SangKO_086810 [Sandaracinaceae bacterium]
MRDVVFDTSALAAMADDASLARRARTMVEGRRVVIPIVALCERLDGKESKYAHAAAMQAAGLAAAAGDSAIAFPARELVRREVWRLGGVRRAAAMSGSELDWWRSLLRVANDASAFEREWRGVLPRIRLILAKEKGLAVDTAAREGFASRVEPGEGPRSLVNLMAAFRELSLGSGPNAAEPVEGHFLAVFVPQPRDRERVRARPARHPATTLLSAYATLIALGASLVDHARGFGRWGGVLKGPERGSWTDARIATTAAYGTLVSNDGGQRARVSFIAREFGLAAQVHSLSEWAVSRE